MSTYKPHFELNQELYTIGLEKLTDNGEDYYVPAIVKDKVLTVTIETKETTDGRDGSRTVRQERWHRLESGKHVGPQNLVREAWMNLDEAKEALKEVLNKDLAENENYLKEYKTIVKKIKGTLKDLENDIFHVVDA